MALMALDLEGVKVIGFGKRGELLKEEEEEEDGGDGRVKRVVEETIFLI